MVLRNITPAVIQRRTECYARLVNDFIQSGKDYDRNTLAVDLVEAAPQFDLVFDALPLERQEISSAVTKIHHASRRRLVGLPAR
ncbi:hypothetical protein [Pseudopelagicola sp. nBUS_19]|uniref:hypothetical protein n=1 Tax=Pseudopelagicola sp. nBUS_19 TaxID=3395316 RepID=UPI003EBB944B